MIWALFIVLIIVVTFIADGPLHGCSSWPKGRAEEGVHRGAINIPTHQATAWQDAVAGRAAERIQAGEEVTISEVPVACVAEAHVVPYFHVHSRAQSLEL